MESYRMSRAIRDKSWSTLRYIWMCARNHALGFLMG